MSDPNQDRNIARIRDAARAAELRMRVGRALRVVPPLLTFALAAAAPILVLRKLGYVGEWRARGFLIADLAIVIVAAVIAGLRKLPPHAGTIALDRHHLLSDRLSNALAFAALPAARRTPLMEAAIEDACDRAAELQPGAAVAIPLPPNLDITAVVAVSVAALAILFVLPIKVVAPTLAPTANQGITMSPDDIELFRDAAKQFDRNDQSPEMKQAVERFNQLIEDLANKRLDRAEAFRKMEAIERELLSKQDADKRALDDALKDTAEDLKKSDLAKPLAEKLQKDDLEKAKEELKKLAEQVKKQQAKPNKAALDKLRDALKKASERKKEALAAINEKRQELREQLLKKKQKPNDADAGPKDDPEEKLLKKKERELERLDREAEQKERVGRQLDKLDKDLAKAAEDLMKDLGMSAQDLEQAAEDINRLQEEQMSDKEKEQLRQRLEELRELLRQQGQGGKKRMSRLMKFGKRARGGQGGQGQKGEKGQGDKGDQEGDEGDDGQDGKDGKDGKNGQGNGGGEGKQWVLGAGGKKILIPGGGQGSMPGGSGQGPGAGQAGNGGSGNEPGGKGIGTGHDGNVAGKSTDLKGQTTDIQEQGIDSQQGGSNSKVIAGAAERGFRGSGYKKAYTDYHTVAEQQINKDQVPDGYRFYVHRYFELIRPRE